MIAETLQKLIDEGVTSAKEISELTGVASSTVYRWLNGKSQPDFNAICMLLRQLPHTNGQQALLTSFMAGTSWQFYNIAADLDVNFDGKVDQEDALIASIESVRGAGESLSRLRGAIDAIEAREPADSMEIIHMLNEVIQHCNVVQQILVRLSDRQPKRARQ